jgi:hypothetical protein
MAIRSISNSVVILMANLSYSSMVGQGVAVQANTVVSLTQNTTALFFLIREAVVVHYRMAHSAITPLKH